MLRTRKVRNKLTGVYVDFMGHATVFNSTFAGKNLLFPIPLREMDVNAELVHNPVF
ncbi:hypothetical protein [Cyclobacterium plantarum]|uniref:hypothetical protein n=1 Tax=Cyclobacterium plantarum TaxID=2716263 RepID=UPI003F6E674C